jgi:hypothetical protein
MGLGIAVILPILKMVNAAVVFYRGEDRSVQAFFA